MNRERLEKLINNHVYTNHSHFVEFLLKQDFIWQDEEVMESFEHPNFYHEEEEADGERVQKDILQWFSVSDWLAEKLEEVGEGILRLQGSCWWGRTQCGIGLTEDETLIRIVKNIERSLNEAFNPPGAQE